MYDLYKERKFAVIFPGGLFLIPVIAFPYGAIKDYNENGLNFNIFMFGFFTLLFLFIFIIIVMSVRSNPYESLNKLKEENPSLLKEIEDDFKVAEDLGVYVWQGRKFTFIRGGNFMVTPIGDITAIEISEVYRRRLGRINIITFKSSTQTEEVRISALSMDREEIIKKLSPVLLASGIEVTICS
ncbi:MAG: hypothetical protein MJ172_08215 [Clostridia bacterium]|nr:hypothetical protein [Clostridia bacterium]